MTTWYGAYLNHLEVLAGMRGSGRVDSGALAELRSAARGGAFEIRALRHVVPLLAEKSPPRDRETRIALLVGQIYASHPPDGASEGRKRSVGRLLGIADRESIGKTAATPDNCQPTPLERHLQIVITTSLDQLATKLRGSFARIGSEGVTLRTDDYAQLFNDLWYWSHPNRNVQYRWVRDFYAARIVDIANQEGD